MANNPLKNKYDIGVIVGRFQVPELSEGHKHLIDNVIESHSQVIVIIGVSPALGTKKNPLGYTARMQMIQQEYQNAIITHVLDINSDDKWSKNVDLIIRSLCPIGSVCLYGGRDSFVGCYSGVYPTFELGITDKKEGTKIRDEVGKEVVNSVDFRKGMIYQTQNQYPKVFPTVDIAVVKKDKKEWRVLMGKRSHDDLYRFPGGFVDPNDESLEETAIRELIEEFDVEVDRDSLQYIGSNRQNDWRYDSPEERITTAFFRVDYMYGGNVKDEFVSCDWILVSPWGYPKVTKSHRPLFEMLMNHLKVKNKLPKNITIEETDHE